MHCYLYIDGKSKKWMKTSLTKWLKHSIKGARQKTHPQQTLVGDPTELTTRDHEMKINSTPIIKRNWKFRSSVPTADAPFRQNQNCQNTAKPTSVWATEGTDENEQPSRHNQLLLRMFARWGSTKVPKTWTPDRTPAQKLLKDLPPYRVRSIWQRIQD